MVVFIAASRTAGVAFVMSLIAPLGMVAQAAPPPALTLVETGQVTAEKAAVAGKPVRRYRRGGGPGRTVCSGADTPTPCVCGDAARALGLCAAPPK